MLRRHEKNTRVQMAKDSLARYNQDPEDFEARIVTETKLGYTTGNLNPKGRLGTGSIRQAPPLKK